MMGWKVLVNFCLSSGNLPQARSFLDVYHELPFCSTMQDIDTHNPNTALSELLQVYRFFLNEECRVHTQEVLQH